MRSTLPKASAGALLVTALFSTAPGALAGTPQPIEEPALALGGRDTVALEEDYFDALNVSPTFAAEPVRPVAESSHESNFYFRINGGLVTTTGSDGPGEEIDFDEGYMVAIAIGKRFPGEPNNVAFDLELEGIWTDQDADTGGAIEAVRDVNVLGGLLNGMVDYRVADRLSVYGGLGAGVAWMDVGTSSDSINDFDDEDGPFLAWQARAGLAYHTQGGAWNLGYRFLNVDDNEIDDDVGGESFALQTEQHVIEIGYSFGAGLSY